MTFDPILADIRFGTGLAPGIAAPASVDQMLSRLAGPDVMANDYPIESYEKMRQRLIALDTARKAFRSAKTGPFQDQRHKEYRQLLRREQLAQSDWLMQKLARRSYTNDGLRERLTAFWADHFTVLGKGPVLKRVVSPHVEGFVRPYLSGRFADLLIAAETSPVMLRYLDQSVSVGPNSERQDTAKRKRGLNENLAREILELHTLGVEGPYDQNDVRQLAELLTGLTYNRDFKTAYKRRWAEPGTETVLGQEYGGDKARLADILQVLTDLARHPATARHLSGKLAVHFLGDNPNPDVIAAMTEAWRETNGDLMTVYRTMLTHPAAWATQRVNVKPPLDFIASALRALSVPAMPYEGKPNEVERWIKRTYLNPLARMGQPYERPVGPDGWPEDDEFWITPQGLANRMQWALETPRALLGKDLPDPRDFVETALGPNAPDAVRFAARAAESRHEGIALVLISPAFQRR